MARDTYLQTDSEDKELLSLVGFKPGYIVFHRPFTLMARWHAPLSIIIFSLPIFLAHFSQASSFYFGASAPAIQHADLPIIIIMGLLAGFLVLGGIVIHELGHLLAARRDPDLRGRLIMLNALGGATFCAGQYQNWRMMARFSAAGPLGSLLSALILFSIAQMSSGIVFAVFCYAAVINGILFLSNLLPFAPMDGYHFLTSLCWRQRGSRQSGKERADLGAPVVLVLILVSILPLFAWPNIASFFIILLFVLTLQWVVFNPKRKKKLPN